MNAFGVEVAIRGRGPDGGTIVRGSEYSAGASMGVVSGSDSGTARYLLRRTITLAASANTSPSLDGDGFDLPDGGGSFPGAAGGRVFAVLIKADPDNAAAIRLATAAATAATDVHGGASGVIDIAPGDFYLWSRAAGLDVSTNKLIKLTNQSGSVSGTFEIDILIGDAS